jgi:hypothetical protein
MDAQEPRRSRVDKRPQNVHGPRSLPLSRPSAGATRPALRTNQFWRTTGPDNVVCGDFAEIWPQPGFRTGRGGPSQRRDWESGRRDTVSVQDSVVARRVAEALLEMRHQRPGRQASAERDHAGPAVDALPSCPHGDSALSCASCRHVGSDAPHRPRELSGVMKTADDCVHADHAPPAAALRSPPSESRPAHG